ncbi:MAG: HD domain-containing protein [Patescibacteria group bacterium]|nr:HD domain-containing protein [Patescibacteria group bacterium]MDD5490365.1 HD domain-containing protein [Patescibacteria group bacterium]
MYDLIQKAVKIAVMAHGNQKRKDNKKLPFIFHPISVGMILLKEGFNDKVVAAGILHDVFEDTNFSKEEMIKEVGEDVVEIVEYATHNNRLFWEEKMEEYIKKLRFAPSGAKAVVAADKIHNLSCFCETYKKSGQNLWKKFHGGRSAQIKFHENVYLSLSNEWGHRLLREYKKLIQKFKKLK